MQTRVFEIRRSVRQALRLGMAAGLPAVALLAGTPAWAACVVTGSGTLGNLGTAATATCTGQNVGVVLGSTNPTAAIVVAEDAMFTGTGSSIAMSGAGDSITVRGSSNPQNSNGTILDVPITMTGDNSSLNLGTSGTTGSGGALANRNGETISVGGNFSRIFVNEDSFLQTTSAVQLGGTGTLFSLATGARLGSDNGYTGVLVQGDAARQTFVLNGDIRGQQAAGIVQTIDAGDGDDAVFLGATTRFFEATSAPGAVFRIAGGAGVDVLNLDGTNTLDGQTLSTTGIETLNKINSGSFTLNGTHAFSAVNVQGGVLDVAGGIGSLGLANATLDISTGAAVSLQQTTQASLTQTLTGAGNLQTNGAVVFNRNNTGFTGTFTIGSGVAIFNVDNAVGSANIVDNGELRLGDITLDNNVVGQGYIRKTSAGTTTLSGTNTHTDTFIDAGRLVAVGGAALGRGAVITQAGTVLEINQAANATINGIFQGAGAFVKSGAGDLTLFQTGVFGTQITGGTSITGGRLIIGGATTLGTGDVAISSGAALQIGQHDFANDISGAGAVEKGSAGVGTLTGNNTYTGGTRVLAGTLQAASAAAIGTGAVTVSGGATFDFSNAASASFGNALAGAGTFQKSGAGDLIFNAANTGLTGTATISAGRVILNDGAAFGSAAITNNAQLRIGNVSVANAISGTGGLEKTATGLGVLSGTNTYSGGTSVAAGTLQVTTAQSLGTGAVSIAAGATLNVANAAAGTLANALTGAGTLVKSGGGELTLTAASTGFTGPTTVSAGRLVLANSAAVGSGAIANNAALRLGDISLSNTITGTGTVDKTSSGLTVLSGTSTYSGGTAVGAGTLRVSSGAALGTGAVTLASGATLDYAVATDQAFGLALSGAGTLLKSGVGMLTFSSPLTVGGLSVSAGRARVNTTLTGSALVASGATLDGTGTLVGTLTNSGRVAPGNSIGTLTVQGNYVQNAGSVLEIEFDSQGHIDLLNVTGSAQINGGTLRLNALGAGEGTGGTFLAAAGGVSGTFSTVEYNGSGVPLAVIYQTGAVATAPSVASARPSTFNSQFLAAASTGFAFGAAVADHALQTGEGGTAWIDAFGSQGSRSASGATLAYDHDAHGAVVGVKWELAEEFKLGAALGWSTADIKLGAAAGGGDQKGVFGSVFAQLALEPVSLAAGAFFGKLSQNTQRTVSFNSTTESIRGETDSSVSGAFIGARAPIAQLAGWQLAADGRFSWFSQEQDAYTEAGTSALRLALPKLKIRSLEASAGLDLARSFEVGSARQMLTPRLALGARLLTTRGKRQIPVSFAAFSADATLQADTRDVTAGYAGASLDWSFSDRGVVRLGYEGQFSEDTRHSANLGVNFRF